MLPAAGDGNVTREYWEKRLSEKWGLHGVGHISYGRPYNEWLYRVRKRVFLRHVKLLPVRMHESVVLDIGSGTGFWINVWKSLNVQTVVGSDLTRVAVENLRRVNPDIDVLELDIANRDAILDVGRTFDIISAFDVLFHIVENARFERSIANIASLLKRGGYFLFSDNLLHSKTRSAAHEVDRTLNDFTRELTENGLRVRARVPMFVLMNTPIDSPYEWHQSIWRFGMLPVRLWPVLGHLYGAALYPLELLLTRTFEESPTTEMVICEKQ